MTMSLVGPYLTTTKYNRKQKKSKSKRLAQATAEHEQWLAKMGVGQSPKKDYRAPMPDYKSSSGNNIPTSDRIDGHAPKTERNVYTGDYIIGITTTHKSNIVPITSKKQAIEASQMRRN